MNFLIPTMFFGTLVAKGLWNLRHSVMFFPSKDVKTTPNSINQPFSNVDITTKSHIVHGWFMPSTNTSAPLIIFSHGNAGNISHRLTFIEFWKQHLAPYYSLYIYDYPGFGNTVLVHNRNKIGKPTVQLCKDALHNVTDYWKQYYPTEKIALYGESIGAAITAVVASERTDTFEKIFIQSTFTSISDIATHLYSNFGFLTKIIPMLPEELDVIESLKKLKRRHQRVIIMHSRTDGLIPWEMFVKMQPYATLSIELEGSHNETDFDETLARSMLVQM